MKVTHIERYARDKHDHRKCVEELPPGVPTKRRHTFVRSIQEFRRGVRQAVDVDICGVGTVDKWSGA